MIPPRIIARITSWGRVELEKKQLRALMRSAGNSVKTKTSKLISKTSGGGRTSYRNGARYRSSAPGQPPVRVSGKLQQSLKTYVYPSGEGFAVRAREFYSLFLEGGAIGGGGKKGSARARRHRRATALQSTRRILEPRPFLGRVMREEAPELERRVKLALDQSLKWRETK